MPKFLGKRSRKGIPVKFAGSYKRHRATTVRAYVQKRSRRSVLQTGKMQYMRCRNVQILDIMIPENTAVPKNAIYCPIAWQRNSNVLGNTSGLVQTINRANPYNTDSRFVQCRPNWKQFAVKGLKVEYVPRSNIATGDEVGTAGMYAMSGLQNMAESVAKPIRPDLMQEPAFKSLNPRRRYTKYISCKKFSKQQHLDWVDATEFDASASNYSNGPLGEPWHMLLWELSHETEDPLPKNLILGTLKLTWFITFRGQES